MFYCCHCLYMYHPGRWYWCDLLCDECGDGCDYLCVYYKRLYPWVWHGNWGRHWISAEGLNLRWADQGWSARSSATAWNRCVYAPADLATICIGRLMKRRPDIIWMNDGGIHWCIYVWWAKCSITVFFVWEMYHFTSFPIVPWSCWRKQIIHQDINPIQKCFSRSILHFAFGIKCFPLSNMITKAF